MIRSSLHLPSRQKREPLKGSLARCSLIVTLLFVSQIIGLERAYSLTNNNINIYRQWAFIQLNNLDEFYCLDELYYNESRWNPRATNGSHYGIPQGRSMYLKNANGYRQVEWGIKYNNKRYGSMCKALQHYKIKGWH